MFPNNESGLSVELPVKPEEESADENNESEDLQLQLDEDEDNGNTKEDETVRSQVGLNSPKNLGKSADSNLDNDTAALDTPTIRDKFDVNSPRKSEELKKLDWTGAQPEKQTNASNTENKPTGKKMGIEDFVTQVSRDPVVQKNKDETDNLETEENLQNAPQPSGFLSCFQCLCCIARPPNPKQILAEANQAIQKEPQTEITPTKTESQLNQPQKNNDEPSISETKTDYSTKILKPILPQHEGKKCLVLDLDETLVHSSFKPIQRPDFIIPVEIDNVVHRAYVLKRPHVDEFLLRASKDYEIVIFTASLAKYADPLLDVLDIHKTVTHRLFRESCVVHGSVYTKDLTKLGRRLKDTIIVDNSPQSYIFQPENAIPITSWFDDRDDTELLELLPVLETTLKNIKDVRKILDAQSKSFQWLCSQANKPLTLFEQSQ